MAWRRLGRRAGLAATAVVLLAAGWALGRLGPAAAQAPASRWHDGPEARGHGHAAAEECARGGRIDGALAAIRASLALTPPQAEPWEAFAAALRDATARWDAACGAVDPDASRVGRGFARAEAALEWITAVRPAQNRLAAALDESQRRTLDGWWTQRRRS